MEVLVYLKFTAQMRECVVGI